MSNQELVKQEKSKFEITTSTGEVLELNKNIVQKYLSLNAQITDDEFMFFFQLCKVHKLNPFLKEAYIIKYGNTPATIVTDYKVLQQIADRSGVFEGVEQGIVVLDKNGDVVERNGQVKAPSDELIGAWCKVYRSDRKMPFYVSVNFDEFKQFKKDGTLNSNWGGKPAFMIEKVAKAHALRVAFPQEMQGVYVEEEVTTEQPLRANYEEVVHQNDPFEDTEIIEAESKETMEVDFNAI